MVVDVVVIMGERRGMAVEDNGADEKEEDEDEEGVEETGGVADDAALPSANTANTEGRGLLSRLTGAPVGGLAAGEPLTPPISNACNMIMRHHDIYWREIFVTFADVTLLTGGLCPTGGEPKAGDAGNGDAVGDLLRSSLDELDRPPSFFMIICFPGVLDSGGFGAVRSSALGSRTGRSETF